MYTLYIVQCHDSTLYTGITTDITRRLKEHNSPKQGAKYTRVRQPVKLVFSQLHPDRSTALKAEAQMKKLSRTQKLELIQAYQTSVKRRSRK